MFARTLAALQPTPRGRILLLLVSIALTAGLGRASLIATAPEIHDFLRLPNQELDIAYGAAGFGFFIGLPLGGVLIELFGTRRVLLIAGAGLAAAICLTGTAWSLTILAVSRLVSGLAVGVLLPAGAAALAPWTPPRERGWAMAALHGALAAGGVLAWALFGLLRPLGAWRGGFLLAAALAAAWVFACRRWFRADPGDGTEPPPPLPVDWRGARPILLLPAALALLQGWGMALCQEWVPRYLLDTWHFDINLSNWVWASGNAAMILGCLAGGIAADRALNQSGNIRSAHQIVPGLGFLLAGFALIMLPVGEDQRAIALWLGLALFGLQAAGTMLWVLAIDIGGRHTGVSAGVIGLGLLISRVASPLYLYDLGKSIPVILGATMLVAAGILSFRLRPHIDLPARRPPAPAEPDEAAEIDKLLTKSRH